jgi:signal transduction histidine kinase
MVNASLETTPVAFDRAQRMSSTSIKRLLLVEDNPGDARLLREMFKDQGSHDTEVTHVESMSQAEAQLAEHAVDIILLDLGLPDAQGLGAVLRAHAAAPHVPLVVLTGLEDNPLAVNALQQGAQDYLIKGQIEPRGLLRALRYAIERKILEEALLGEKQRAQVLLERTMHAGEQERKRLAAEIHDGPVQQLTALDIRLETLRDRIGSADSKTVGLVERVQAGMQTSIGDLRRMMVELHPPALRERGLEAALGDYMQGVQRASGVLCQLECDIAGRLEPDIETTMYRIAQEALVNVVKHANAKTVVVSIHAGDHHIELEVRDDGAGFRFDPDQTLPAKGEHYGLIGMRERAEMVGGSLEIHSIPFAGTTIRATSPMGVSP